MQGQDLFESATCQEMTNMCMQQKLSLQEESALESPAACTILLESSAWNIICDYLIEGSTPDNRGIHNQHVQALIDDVMECAQTRVVIQSGFA